MVMCRCKVSSSDWNLLTVTSLHVVLWFPFSALKGFWRLDSLSARPLRYQDQRLSALSSWEQSFSVFSFFAILQCYAYFSAGSLTFIDSHIFFSFFASMARQNYDTWKDHFVLISCYNFLSLWFNCPIGFLGPLRGKIPPPSKAIQMTHCRIIPQPLRYAGLVRPQVLSWFALATKAEAGRKKNL